MNFSLLDIINSIAVFQLTIFITFLIHKGRRNLSNVILATFLFCQLLTFANWLLVTLVWNHPKILIHVYCISFPVSFLWAPLMLIYIKSKVEQNFRLRFRYLFHLIPFFIALAFIIIQYHLKDSTTKLHMIQNGIIQKLIEYYRIGFYVNIQVFLYNCISLFILHSYQWNLKYYESSVEKQDLNWLKFVLYGYIIVCLITEISFFTNNILPISSELKYPIILALFLIFFNVLIYKTLIRPYSFTPLADKPKPTDPFSGKIDFQKYSKHLEEFMTAKKLFLNPTLTLRELSDATNVPEKIISQVLNHYYNQNFYMFVNSFRVDESKKLLKSNKAEKMTMLGIAFESGFNSKTVFYNTFKKQIGMTPTDYRRQNCGLLAG
jgi:AraC-like DNA-binding protein